jgi:REP element-mobilizing transposase RayT
MHYGRYHGKSIRSPYWDYTKNASYFITIVTKNRKMFFGDIKDHILQLSEIGTIAEKYWDEIPDHFPYCVCGPRVIMPDHIHGVLTIRNSIAENVKDTQNNNLNPNNNAKNKDLSKISPKEGSLGVIIRSYKSAVTKDARIINPGFGWHRRYYDKIIRTKYEYKKIKEYIQNNPSNR